LEITSLGDRVGVAAGVTLHETHSATTVNGSRVLKIRWASDWRDEDRCGKDHFVLSERLGCGGSSDVYAVQGTEDVVKVARFGGAFVDASFEAERKAPAALCC
jgi:hypothetical protein